MSSESMFAKPAPETAAGRLSGPSGARPDRNRKRNRKSEYGGTGAAGLPAFWLSQFFDAY